MEVARKLLSLYKLLMYFKILMKTVLNTVEGLSAKFRTVRTMNLRNLCYTVVLMSMIKMKDCKLSVTKSSQAIWTASFNFFLQRDL